MRMQLHPGIKQENFPHLVERKVQSKSTWSLEHNSDGYDIYTTHLTVSQSEGDTRT